MSAIDTTNDHALGDGLTAVAVDRPATVEELRETVARRAGEGHAVYPQGGRTALDYGGAPRRPGVAVDLRGLDRVIDYPAADMTITVEAGMTLASLQATLAEEGQRLPLDAPFPSQATLGGIYATNASGPRRFGAGRPRDFIIGVSFVTADGNAVKGGGRVVKNVAGYDFPKLMTGSMGTLGIITQLTLKVRPKPESSAIAWCSFDSLEDLAAALNVLNTSATRPMALEVFNANATGRLPGVGDLPAPAWALAVGIEDNLASVAWQVDRLREELPGREIILFREAEAEPLWAAMADFPALAPGPLSFVANLGASDAIDLLRLLPPDVWAVQAHAGNGIVRGHLVAHDRVQTIGPEIDRLRAAAVRAGGNLILARCPTEQKAALKVWGEPRGDWAVMEQVKKALDPGWVMNPGRFVGMI